MSCLCKTPYNWERGKEGKIKAGGNLWSLPGYSIIKQGVQQTEGVKANAMILKASKLEWSVLCVDLREEGWGWEGVREQQR